MAAPRPVAVLDPVGAADRAAGEHLVVQLGEVAGRFGLAGWGIADASPFVATRRALEERRAAGLHGGMQFTYRNPARSTEPDRLVPGARSIVAAALGYFETPPARPADGPCGVVARYAWRDHYAELRGALGAMAGVLVAAGWRAAVSCDDNALVDRAAAWRAGVGWFGKSANVLVPGHGSWVVLGSVVTDAALPVAAAPVADGCGSCTRCLEGCPTGAIVAPGVVDARRCLAWLVQAPGAIPVEHRAALGDRIYGCDDCQEVCPPNRTAGRHRPPPVASVEAEAWVVLLDLLAAEDAALLAAHGRWYVPGRDPRHLRRNALVALGNVADPADRRVLAALRFWAAGPDDLLADHASWALGRLAERADPAAPEGAEHG